MNVIFSACEMGFTKLGNLGALKAIDDGCISMAEVMLDMPGSMDALEALKPRPWITLTWGVSTPYQTDQGNDSDQDLHRLIAKKKEQILTCIRITGKAPFAAMPEEGIAGEARKAVCGEFGILYGYEQGQIRVFTQTQAMEQIFDTDESYDPLPVIQSVLSEAMLSTGISSEDSTSKEEPDGIIPIIPLKPAFMDEYILKHTLERVPELSSIHRLKDAQVLCSKTLSDWIAQNGLTIVSLRDAVLGTCDYQNHLRANRAE